MTGDDAGADGPESGSVLPRWGWVTIVGLFALAALTLLIPEEVATSRGIPFRVFFWVVLAVQGIAAFGIIGVFVYNVVE